VSGRVFDHLVSRLAIDQLRRARTTRETYIGTWLPEPVSAAAFDPLTAWSSARRCRWRRCA